jgi:hypothetical protein
MRLAWVVTAAVTVLCGCETAPAVREVTEADRVVVFTGATRHWVFDKVREYLQESVILVPAPKPLEPERILRYRQARKVDVLSASEEDGLVVARWEMKENEGGWLDRIRESDTVSTVLRTEASFREVEGGMEIALSIISDTGEEADRLYYARFWKFMTGRWE